jgi:hypothetical protein
MLALVAKQIQEFRHPDVDEELLGFLEWGGK